MRCHFLVWKSQFSVYCQAVYPMAQSGLSCDIEVAWGHISLGVAPWCDFGTMSCAYRMI